MAGTTAIRVVADAKDKVPAVGEPAPRTETDTLESVRGDTELLDYHLLDAIKCGHHILLKWFT